MPPKADQVFRQQLPESGIAKLTKVTLVSIFELTTQNKSHDVLPIDFNQPAGTVFFFEQSSQGKTANFVITVAVDGSLQVVAVTPA